MRTAEIARRFVRFFEERGHTVVPSAALPFDDPTLLFVNAGMVPFKPYFLGDEQPPYARAVSVQKCVRTLDIDEVGKTTRHASFFQMNGNFSFGDYFKEEAIQFAWELVTKPQSEGGYGFEESRLWPTVYHDDDQAAEIWRRVTGLPEERIQRRGMADNYWSMGVPGPCGPCSEIFYDRGPEYGPDGGPEVDEDRYMELWNLVFMQNIRGEGTGKEDYPILGELPAKNIDTGMGLERVAYILQGVENLYETDQVRPVLDRAADLASRRYGADHEDDVRLRVVADHVRTALMIVGDGVVPGNEGRGYVLRRILRRAVRAMRLLGVDEPTMPELLPLSKAQMQETYPELDRDWQRVSQVVYNEEEAFRETLRTGTQIFEQAVGQTKRAGRTQLAGAEAFQLHDTYGFPIDLTLEMAAEQGLSVDEAGFATLMDEQRQRAKADSQAKKTGHVDMSVYSRLLGTAGRSEFLGYTDWSAEAKVLGLLVDGESVYVAGPGSQVEVVLDRTPFYAESGGQLADHGRVRTDTATVDVADVQSPVAGLIVHRGKVLEGELRVGDTALGEIDLTRRRSIARSHTATHMVHKAVREILGETATQAGSENAPGRLRFDFTSQTSLAANAVQDAEDRINNLVVENLEVQAAVMPKDEALGMGAMALFGQKYSDEVRVVSVGGDWSLELCGGTHTEHTSLLGVVKLLGESSIGSGVRRVEALVGTDAMNYLSRESLLVSQLADLLKAPRADLPDRVAQTMTRLRDAEKEIARLRAAQLLDQAGELADSAADVAGVALVTHRAPDGTTGDDLRKLVTDLRRRFGSRPAVAAVAAVNEERPVLVVAVTDAGRERGLRAGELVGVGANALGGGGGGKDDIAQGGGSRPEAVTDALQAVAALVRERAGGQ
ncbi:MAG: alanine--tRNA ligase [Streptosporangiales bacterium]|nr:alanine--tRNA ligase [Streptosporangiales bacterium]